MFRCFKELDGVNYLITVGGFRKSGRPLREKRNFGTGGHSVSFEACFHIVKVLAITELISRLFWLWCPCTLLERTCVVIGCHGSDDCCQLSYMLVFLGKKKQNRDLMKGDIFFLLNFTTLSNKTKIGRYNFSSTYRNACKVSPKSVSGLSKEKSINNCGFWVLDYHLCLSGK